MQERSCSSPASSPVMRACTCARAGISAVPTGVERKLLSQVCAASAEQWAGPRAALTCCSVADVQSKAIEVTVEEPKAQSVRVGSTVSFICTAKSKVAWSPVTC